jgi:hypothetical protein
MKIFISARNDKPDDIAYATGGCMTSHAAGSEATVELPKEKSSSSTTNRLTTLQLALLHPSMIY